MHFLSEDLEAYIQTHSQPEPALLKALARETYQKVLQPRMITGHHQGRLLSMISKITAPKFILEIGTYTGYSALCLAEGLAPGGQLHTVEINEELASIQKFYFDQSSYGKKIHPHIGDALDIVPTLPFEFDLVFIDGKKSDYNSYWEVVLPKVRKGGIILCDNVLWSGKVARKTEAGDQATAALKTFNKNRLREESVEVVILPVRDGLSVCRVLESS